MGRTAGFLTGAGAGAAAFACLVGNSPVGAAGAVAAALLLHAVTAPGRPLAVGSALFGGAGGLALALRIFPGAGSATVLGVGVALLLAGVLLARVSPAASPGAPGLGPTSTRRYVAVSSGLAFVVLLGAVSRAALPTTGDDPATRTFLLAPLLVAAGIGAGVVGFLVRRHASLAPRLPFLLSLAAIGTWLLEARSLDEIFALADRIQGPSVTRRHFLFGASLLAGSLGGFTAAVLGGLLASKPAAASWLVRGGVALGIAAAAVHPIPTAVGVGLLVTAAGVSKPRRVSRVGASFIAAGLLLLLGLRPSITEWVRGHSGPRVLDEIRTHSVGEGRTSAWPFAEVLLATWPASSTDPRPRIDAARDSFGAPVAALLKSLGLLGAASDARSTGSMRYRLGEWTFPQLRLAARLACEEMDAPVTFLDGRNVVFSHDESGDPYFRNALLPDLRLALSTEATAALAAEAGDGRIERLVLRAARTRISPFRPALAAANLRRLVRRADRLDEGDLPHHRLELDLGAAILDDDAEREDRVLDQLERFDSARARALRAERAAAREKLHEFLVAARDADPADADVRHRLGLVYLRSGRTLAGLAELTRALELRPKLLAAGVDLMEGYLRAEEEGVHRWSAGGGPLSNLDTVAAVHRMIRRELDDPDLAARAGVALARLRLLEADAEGDPERAEQLRREAFARANFALLHDATDAAAHRVLAEALLARRIRPDGAHGHAQEAVRLDPHDPRNHRTALRAARTPDQRRHALVRALRHGVSSP
ncbi:MAG: hypothetical protein ACF8XB_13945 [Planctomycetota bacterium JB042]